MYAEHIPGVYNTVADVESRQSFELNDWKIHKGVFIQLQKVLNRPFCSMAQQTAPSLLQT